MGISHGSSWQHVTIWSIFGHGRRFGLEPEAVHIGQGLDPVTSVPHWQSFDLPLRHSGLTDVVFPIFSPLNKIGYELHQLGHTVGKKDITLIMWQQRKALQFVFFV